MIDGPTSYLVPTVVEQTNRGERGYDLLFKAPEREYYFIGTPIDDGIANLVCAQLLHLESENPDKDISLYINSLEVISTRFLPSMTLCPTSNLKSQQYATGKL